MVGNDLEVSFHHLNIDPKFISHMQKMIALSSKRYKALKEKEKKLILNWFIREDIYLKWIFNPILVKKHNGKWKVGIEFSNINQTCSNNSLPFLMMDELVDSAIGHELLSFMVAYSGYN